MTPVLRIGLTGGIGAGKSTVAARFASRGVPVIDMDEIARDLTRPGAPAHEPVVEIAGPDVLDPQGGIRRDELRRRAFADDALRRALEQLLHPLIIEEAARRTAGADYDYCIICIPLLVESGATGLVDRVLVVDAPESLQLARAERRDGRETGQIERIIRAQASREQRLAAADDVIHNDSDLDHLDAQVERLHAQYLRTAREHVATST